MLRAHLSVAATAIVLAACVRSSGPVADDAPGRSAAGRGAGAARGALVTSNVTRGDYAGSAACKRCHESEHRTWAASPMHQMTRRVQDARIEAPFDGSTFRFKDDTARLETRAGRRFVTVTSARYGTKTYEVTRVIGGHHREDFVGSDGFEELVLPVSWMLEKKTFRYKGYSVMVHERDGLRAGPVWNKTCILCHNTAPYLLSTFGAIAGPGSRPYQGEVVDALLPRARQAQLEVTDEDAFERAVDRELGALGAKLGTLADDRPATVAARAVEATRSFLKGEHLLEVGIGCESCHGGARQHVDDPRVLPSFEPRASFLRVRGVTSRAQAINRACARCHQVLFSGYPHTWEGGRRSGGLAGGSNINSGEARDMLMGACASAMSCVDCHDPHVRESGGRVARLDTTEEGDRVCTRCHAELADRERLRAHAHHAPEGEGARCMNCHMPKKNMSLEGTLSRYHRVASPTDREKVERDRPLECALCHTDKTVRAILADVQRLWGRRYDEDMMRALYPDLDANAIAATLEHGKPHEQAVALAKLGTMGERARPFVPLVEQATRHEYPIVAGYAERALEALRR